MITNFNNQVFLFKNLTKWLVFFLICFMLSGSPLFIVNTGTGVIYQVNASEFLCSFMNRVSDFVYFGINITLVFASVLNAFFYECALVNDIDLNHQSTSVNNENIFGDSLIVDFSNPFLHGCKTKGLRE